MAKTIIGGATAPIHPSPTGTPREPALDSASLPPEHELRIDVRPDQWVEFEGSAEQLQAEGVIPDGFEWPRAADDKYWEANGFNYWLRRARPPQHRGPMRTWLEIDNWFIRIGVVGHDSQWFQRRQIEHMAENLRDEIHRLTPTGKREWDTNWQRHWAARCDEAFQAFKVNMLPERKKPGRKPKLATGAGVEGGAL